jgi:hypothetical protein
MAAPQSKLRISLLFIHRVLDLPDDVKVVDANADWRGAALRGVMTPEVLLTLEGNVPDTPECTAIVRKEYTTVTLHPVEKK